MEHTRFTAKMRHQPWIFALVAGAGTGVVVLGIGGRIAMRLFGVHSGQPAGWSVGGTMTVIFMGLVSGVGGAAIRAAASSWLPRRTPPVVGTVVFVLACTLLTLRGLNPVDATRLAYFLPVIVAYMTVFEVLWRRRPVVVPAELGPAPAGVVPGAPR